MVSPNADENSAIVSAPTVPTLSPTAVSPTPTAVSPTPTAVSMPKPAIVPALVLGAPLAIAAAPMIASYALFPVVSGVGYLLPEATMETIEHQ
jgi:hypothetical protein